jgi:predicted ribonuclease YlaK
VRCNGKWLTVGIAVDATNGMVLSIDELPGEDAEQLKAWLEPILDAFDADVVVSDDADAFKKVCGDKVARIHCSQCILEIFCGVETHCVDEPSKQGA